MKPPSPPPQKKQNGQEKWASELIIQSSTSNDVNRSYYTNVHFIPMTVLDLREMLHAFHCKISGGIICGTMRSVQVRDFSLLMNHFYRFKSTAGQTFSFYSLFQTLYCHRHKSGSTRVNCQVKT